MRALSAREFLGVWEQSATRSRTGRALALLGAACPDTPAESLARLSLGERDRRLLMLRTLMFGPRLASLAKCPACGARLESTFDAAELVPNRETAMKEDLSLLVDGYRVRFRLPSSDDLAEIENERDATAARDTLLNRCVLEVHCNDQEISTTDLPGPVVKAVADRMEQAEPEADIRLGLSCPACGHRWQASLDIAAFFWAELDAWAHRTLREVHALASAYGWREVDVLALSPWRRQFYLEMVGG